MQEKGCQIIINVDDVNTFMTALTKANVVPQETISCGDYVQIPAVVWNKLQKLACASKIRVKNLQALEMINLIKQLK